MAEAESKKVQRRKLTSEKRTPYEGPVPNSPNPFEGWTRDGKPIGPARYITIETAKKALEKYGRGGEAIDYICNIGRRIDCFGLGGIVVFKNSKGNFDYCSIIVDADPPFDNMAGVPARLFPNSGNLEAKAANPTPQTSDDVALEAITEAEDADKLKERKEDDGPFDMTSEESKYKPEPTKPTPKSKPDYKPKPDSEYKPQSRPTIKPAPKPAPKPKPSLKK